MTGENANINEDDFVIIEEFDGRGNKIRRAIRKATEKKDFSPIGTKNEGTDAYSGRKKGGSFSQTL